MIAEERILKISLDEAIAGGDAFTIRAVAKRDAANAHERGYLAGVQDYGANLRYALDTGPNTTPIAWFRFHDDDKLAKAALNESWEDLRIINIQEGAN